jgi:N-acyl-D-aspartate/D-glutamate deacylase
MLSRYVHDEQPIPLEQAIYKMTGGPTAALKSRDGGLLLEGCLADIANFDPNDFRDRRLMQSRINIRAERISWLVLAPVIQLPGLPIIHCP